jgi:hypothetical protein
MAGIGVMALLLVMPVLWPALRVYVAANRNLTVQTVVSQAEVAQVMEGYFEFGWGSVPVLAARPWLLALAGLALLIGMVRGNRLTWLAAGWLAMLSGLGFTYLLGVPMLNLTNLGAVLIMLYLPLGLIVGAGAQEVVDWLRPSRWRGATTGVVAALLVSGLMGAGPRVQEIEPFRFFVTGADLEAMQWINENLPPEAEFAVNTHYWLATTPHGTDAGYWLPYFTNRRMTAAVMVSSLGSYAYQGEVLETAALVKRLETDPTVIDELRRRGIEYVYIGERGNFEGPGLQADLLVDSGRATVLYTADRVAILRLHAAD